jgi:hypothetical protein
MPAGVGAGSALATSRGAHPDGVDKVITGNRRLLCGRAGVGHHATPRSASASVL